MSPKISLSSKSSSTSISPKSEGSSSSFAGSSKTASPYLSIRFSGSAWLSEAANLSRSSPLSSFVDGSLTKESRSNSEVTMEKSSISGSAGISITGSGFFFEGIGSISEYSRRLFTSGSSV